MKAEFLIPGIKMLESRPDFKLVGRDQELIELMKVLMRHEAHNVILSGQGGVGCSAICFGLQQAKASPNTPYDISHKRIWWLDVDGMFSKPEETQEAFEAMMRVLTRTSDKDTVLVVEDTRDFIEAIQSTGNGSFINQIMRQVERGTFQIIFETRDTDLEFVMNCHSNMREMFTLMEVKEPQRDALTEIVTAASESLVTHHGIPVSPEAIEQAIYLTTTYPGKETSLARAQPEASLTLLDRALATYRNNAHTNPPMVASAQAVYDKDPSAENKALLDSATTKWNRHRDMLANAMHEQSVGEQQLSQMEARIAEINESKPEPISAGGIPNYTQEERELMTEINTVRGLISKSTMEYNELSGQINAGLELDTMSVFREFSNLSGIPFDKLDEDDDKKLLDLPNVLKKKIFGQDHVIDQLSNALLTASVPGLKEKGKPNAAFMFCGSSGVGKTALAKELAIQLKDDEGALLRFDMSEYKTSHTVASLIGAPPGYAGYDAGGVLTNAVRKNPNAMILFDEIEKADPSIFDIFLQVLDDGRLTDTQGRVVSFEHTTLIFTTNIGHEYMLDQSLEYKEQMEGTLEELGKVYRSEFLNRFGGRENIVSFKILPIEVIKLIARGQLNKVNKGFESAGVSLRVDMHDDDIERLCTHQYDPARGARGIDGVFRNSVYPQMARLIKSGKADGHVCNIKFDNGVFDVVIEA